MYFYAPLTNTIHFARKRRNLNLHDWYEIGRNHIWRKIGTYSTKQIEAAVTEGTIQEISRRTANRVKLGEIQLGQNDTQSQ